MSEFYHQIAPQNRNLSAYFPHTFRRLSAEKLQENSQKTLDTPRIPMKASEMRRRAEAILSNESERGPAKSWDEVTGRVMADMNARRTIELCDIFDGLTADEKSRLAAIPLFKSKPDLRNVADIRSKHGVSWRELETLCHMAR